MSANGKLEAAMQVEGDSEEEEEVEAPKRKETASAQDIVQASLPDSRADSNTLHHNLIF